jgi:hypothetical protein
MAKAYIAEFIGVNEGSPSQPPIATQVITFTTTTQSAAFNARTTLVRIHVDAISSVEFGSNPTATTSSSRLAANQTEYFAVSAGHKAAFITNT